MFKYFIRYVYVRQNRICHQGSIFSSWSVSGDPYRDLQYMMNSICFCTICMWIQYADLLYLYLYWYLSTYGFTQLSKYILSYTHAACTRVMHCKKGGNFEQLQCMYCTVKFSNNVDTRIGHPLYTGTVKC